jgi:hypothetical protein
MMKVKRRVLSTKAVRSVRRSANALCSRSRAALRLLTHTRFTFSCAPTVRYSTPAAAVHNLSGGEALIAQRVRWFDLCGAGHSACAPRHSALGADTPVRKSGNSSADALFTQGGSKGVGDLDATNHCCERSQSALSLRASL